MDPQTTSEPLVDGNRKRRRELNRQDTVRAATHPLCIIFIIFAVIGFVSIFLFKMSLHHVQEGFVAVYYRVRDQYFKAKRQKGGALLDDVSGPGYHLLIPFLTSYKQIQVTIQTDEIHDVPCGTSGGVVIYFDNIEVVNILRADSVHKIVKSYTPNYDKTLIHDKIHHEINQFCSKHTIQDVYIDLFDTIDENLKNALQKEVEVMAKGLSVQSVRVTKPRIPDSVALNYEKMEAAKTELLAAAQQQKVVEKVAETERKKAVIEAEKNSQVAAIRFNQTIAEKEMEKTVNRLQDEINLAKQKAMADADYYKSSRAAEANDKLITDKFLELKRIEAIQTNNKIFYGNSIPDAFLSGEAGKSVALTKKT